MTMKPPPPTPDENGSVTPSTPAAVTAASTALPPPFRVSIAAWVASVSTVAAAPPVPVAVAGPCGPASAHAPTTSESTTAPTASRTTNVRVGRRRMGSSSVWLRLENSPSRAAAKRPRTLAAGDRPRVHDDGRGRGRLPRRDLGAVLAGLLPARRARRADRRRRGERDRLTPGHSASACDADRGREPDQRRDCSRRVPVRRRGGSDGQLLVVARIVAFRRRRRRRRCDRSRNRVRAPPDPAPDESLADRDR